MADPAIGPTPGMRVAPGASPDARQTPGAALTNAILGPQLSGLPGEPSHQEAMQGLMKALGLPENTQINDRNAGPIQERLLQHLGQLGVDVGQPPSLEKAREAMISALQTQPGMSREELGNASLTDLMARFKGLREQQARPQQDGVEPRGPRQPPPGAEPRSPGDPRRGGPTPGAQRGVRTGGRHQHHVRRAPRSEQQNPAAARHRPPTDARPAQHRARVERTERPPADPQDQIRQFAGAIDQRFTAIRALPNGQHQARVALIREAGITTQNLAAFQEHLSPATRSELTRALTESTTPPGL